MASQGFFSDQLPPAPKRQRTIRLDRDDDYNDDRRHHEPPKKQSKTLLQQQEDAWNARYDLGCCLQLCAFACDCTLYVCAGRCGPISGYRRFVSRSFVQ